jgi:hypothetical protein
MPGAIGTLGTADEGRFAAALRKLEALPGCTADRHLDSDGVRLATVSRGSSVASRDGEFLDDGDAALLLYGAAFREDPVPHRVRVDELLAALRRGQLVEFLAECDGGFSVVAIDRRAGKAWLLADRFGSQPIYYAVRGGTLAFAPEAKAVLTMTGASAAWSRDGLLGFLVVGYNLCASTLFEGVSYLEPGTVLVHDLRGGAPSVRRYWTLEFEPSNRFRSRDEGERALFDAVLRGHRLLLSDGPCEHQILLSGGVDSRGMLGALRRVGSPPRQAIAWGARKDLRCSDAYIAERIARASGVPFRFLPYDTRAFADNASEWAFRSELATDNMGWFGEGLGSLRDFYAATSRVSFVGDELWGYGGRYASERAVIAQIVPSEPGPVLGAVLRRAVAAELRESHDARLRGALDACSSRDLGDRRDFLYQRLRFARYILSLGYYKEHATELRRPFVTRPVLEVVRRLPRRFRTYKNLYRTMLARFMPETVALPDNVVSSLPDWSFDVRRDPRLSVVFRELLDFRELERGPLCELLERRPFEALRDRFLSEDAAPEPRTCGAWQMMTRAALLRSPFLIRANTARKTVSATTAPARCVREFDVIRRVALLALLHRRLPDLARA